MLQLVTVDEIFYQGEALNGRRDPLTAAGGCSATPECKFQHTSVSRWDTPALPRQSRHSTARHGFFPRPTYIDLRRLNENISPEAELEIKRPQPKPRYKNRNKPTGLGKLTRGGAHRRALTRHPEKLLYGFRGDLELFGGLCGGVRPAAISAVIIAPIIGLVAVAVG
ncbi:hypothetical protein C8F04DRAFT_1187931 [Mycena alexandri]|uniref:Uncharacterized protein n=1 Tax=Mycena alexandri TaxID=1745969 RepID=A0AAD6WZE1_9AGAR|nr:hypothetical protein C8F04DRAFT_1187931 [Mycena alexandri]